MLVGIAVELLCMFYGQGFHNLIRQLIGMWKPFKVDNIGYIMKNVSVDGHHKVLLSNFVNMWGEEITSASLCRRCKCFNPLVEGDEESLAQWTLAQISEGSTATISMKECEDAQVMEINSKLAGVPVTVKFYLKKMTLQEMYREITLPLLLMIQQLQAQKCLLFDLIKKKDAEITEYKLEGAKLPRRSMETPTFNESHFEQLCAAIKIPNECHAQPVQLFSQEMQNLYVEVMNKYENSKELNEAGQQDANAAGSRTQSTFTDSSPEEKQKQNLKPKECESDEHQKTTEREAETRSLAKRRKEAMKKKQLNL